HLGERDCLPPSFVMAFPSACLMPSPRSSDLNLLSKRKQEGRQVLLETLPGRPPSTTSMDTFPGRGYGTWGCLVDTRWCVVFWERRCWIVRPRSSAAYS